MIVNDLLVKQLIWLAGGKLDDESRGEKKPQTQGPGAQGTLERLALSVAPVSLFTPKRRRKTLDLVRIKGLWK